MRTVSADRHAVEDGLELAPRRLVVVAMEPDRGLPDALDQVEHVGALLVAHGVAENAAEQPDVVPQPRVFLSADSSTRLARISVSEGMIWGRHGWLLQKLPGSSGVCKFFAAAQDKDGGGATRASPFEALLPARRRDPTLTRIKSSAPPAPNRDRAGGA